MRPMVAATVAQLRSDPALPARDVLLDDGLAAETFAEVLGAEGLLPVRRVERLRVKYRAGESLRCVHRVWSGDDSWLVSSRMRATGAAELYADAKQQERPSLPLRGVSYSDRCQTVFWTFPNDRRLGAAAALSPRLPAIQRAWPGLPAAVDVVGYNPERAVVARVTDAERRTLGFAKLYAAAGDMASAYRTLTWLGAALGGASPALRVPSIRGCDSERHVLLVDAVAGRHLQDVPEGDLTGAFFDLGTALGRLHSLPLPPPQCPLPSFSTFTTPELMRAATAIGWARPDLAYLARRTATCLSVHRPAVGGLVGLHGDMNSRNWLAGASRTAARTCQSAGEGRAGVGLIDFDEAATGPAASDLGGVLGWLRGRRVLALTTAAREQELAGALQAGYSSVRPWPGRQELRWCCAAALLIERSLRAITRVRHDELARLDLLVAAAYAEATEAARA